MKDGDSVTEHLNAFNTVVSQLLSVDIKISSSEDEDNDDKKVTAISGDDISSSTENFREKSIIGGFSEEINFQEYFSGRDNK